MRVLQIAHKPPKPSKDGGSLAIANLTENLLSLGADVTLLSINTSKHPFGAKEANYPLYQKLNHRSFFLETKPNPIDAFSNFVTNDSYHVTRFFSVSLDLYLSELLKEEEFDLVILESIFSMPYFDTIRRYSKAKIALRAHNIEHLIWENITKSYSNKFIVKYLEYANKLLKAYEEESIRKVDAVITLTENDLSLLKSYSPEKPFYCNPFSVNVEKLSNLSKNNEPINFDLFHIGAMDWVPNQQGISWFVKEIFSDLNQTQPDLELHLAGKSLDHKLYEKNKGVINHGEVASSIDFMSSHSALIVPLHAASGQRVKIVQAMAMGKPIISTSLGAKGLNLVNGTHFIEANSESEFKASISALKSNKELQRKLSENCISKVKECFDVKIELKNLENYLLEILNSTRRAPSLLS
jgi:glycosyltransferase involved in cell wall biosynthesis